MSGTCSAPKFLGDWFRVRPEAQARSGSIDLPKPENYPLTTESKGEHHGLKSMAAMPLAILSRRQAGPGFERAGKAGCIVEAER
jgi:hypothetical protein